jgi:hypothetical protein
MLPPLFALTPVSVTIFLLWDRLLRAIVMGRA